MAVITAVLQVERKARVATQLHNRRRVHRKSKTVTDIAHKGTHHLTGHRSGIAARSTTFAPVFQGSKRHRHILAGTGKAEAGNGNQVFHFGHGSSNLINNIQSRIGTLFGGTGRQLHTNHHITLVFLWQETGRQSGNQEEGTGGQGDINNRHAADFMHHFGHNAGITVGGAVEFAVEPTEKAFFLVMAVFNRLEQGGAQRRG